MTKVTTSAETGERTARTAKPRVGTGEARGSSAWDREGLNMRWKLARVLVDSGYLPDGVDRPEQALFVILKGEELGLPPLQALTSINVIEGTPTLSGALLMALCIRHADCHFEVKRREADGAAVTIHRPDWPPYTAEFDAEDAERAGLLDDSYWERYPKAMHFWRAAAAAARTVCPDVVAGLYMPEEVGGQEGPVPDPDAGPAPIRDDARVREALEERYLEAWRELVPESEARRQALRDRWVADHPRLPDAHEDWSRRHWVLAIRELEREGREVLRGLVGASANGTGGKE